MGTRLNCGAWFSTARLFIYDAFMTMERSTKQRSAIREAIESANRPLSPAEILRAASKHVSGMGMATVYRTIKAMTGDHQIVSIEMPGEPARYEIAGKEHHHHFSCRACGKVFEVEGCPGDLSALAPPGFEAESHEVILYGRCVTCVSTVKGLASKSAERTARKPAAHSRARRDER